MALDAVAFPVAAEVARRAEEFGYASFWVSGSPPDVAFESLAAAGEATSLDLGVGVVPLTSTSVEDIVARVRTLGLPQHRLWLGVGSKRKPGGLADVRHAVRVLRSETDARVVTGAIGPKMTRLAGEIADAVLFAWSTAQEVSRSLPFLAAGAMEAKRRVPLVASYVHCAFVPQASEAVAEVAARYDVMPKYAEVFARAGGSAADIVVTGTDSGELRSGIEREESVLDLPIIRVITPDGSVSSITALLEACAPFQS